MELMFSLFFSVPFILTAVIITVIIISFLQTLNSL